MRLFTNDKCHKCSQIANGRDRLQTTQLVPPAHGNLSPQVLPRREDSLPLAGDLGFYLHQRLRTLQGGGVPRSPFPIPRSPTCLRRHAEGWLHVGAALSLRLVREEHSILPHGHRLRHRPRVAAHRRAREPPRRALPPRARFADVVYPLRAHPHERHPRERRRVRGAPRSVGRGHGDRRARKGRSAPLARKARAEGVALELPRQGGLLEPRDEGHPAARAARMGALLPRRRAARHRRVRGERERPLAL